MDPLLNSFPKPINVRYKMSRTGQSVRRDRGQMNVIGGQVREDGEDPLMRQEVFHWR